MVSNYDFYRRRLNGNDDMLDLTSFSDAYSTMFKYQFRLVCIKHDQNF